MEKFLFLLKKVLGLSMIFKAAARIVYPWDKAQRSINVSLEGSSVVISLYEVPNIRIPLVVTNGSLYTLELIGVELSVSVGQMRVRVSKIICKTLEYSTEAKQLIIEENLNPYEAQYIKTHFNLPSVAVDIEVVLNSATYIGHKQKSHRINTIALIMGGS